MERVDRVYYTSGQAATKLGVSQEWIRQLYLAGTLPAKTTILGRLYPRRNVDGLAARRIQKRMQESSGAA